MLSLYACVVHNTAAAAVLQGHAVHKVQKQVENAMTWSACAALAVEIGVSLTN